MGTGDQGILVEPGKLFYVVGASGAGKDSILKQIKVQTGDSHNQLLVAHRYITRHTDTTEGSIYLTESEFQLRKEKGLFALDWQSNHYRYGIGCEINQWLKTGLSVVINGSREYWPQARHCFPDNLYTILIDVPESVLLKRLRQRNRETESDIATRLSRHSQLQDSFTADGIVNNHSSLNDAVSQFLSLVDSVTQ